MDTAGWLHWKRVQESDRSVSGKRGDAFWPSASCGCRGRKPRQPAGRTSWQVAWRRGLRVLFTLRACNGHSTRRKSTGDFSSLTRGMRSMRRTGQPCYGLSGTSGLVACGLHTTATATGPHSWSGPPRTGQATSCTARRAWPRGTPSPWSLMASGSSPS